MACLGYPPEHVIRAAPGCTGKGTRFSQHCPAASAPAQQRQVAAPRERGEGQGNSPEPDCPARRDRAACAMPRELRAALNPVQGLCRARLFAGMPCAGQGPRAPGSRVNLWMWCAVTVGIQELIDMPSLGLRFAAMRAQQVCCFLFPKYMLLVVHVGWSSIAPSSVGLSSRHAGYSGTPPVHL